MKAMRAPAHTLAASIGQRRFAHAPAPVPPPRAALAALAAFIVVVVVSSISCCCSSSILAFAAAEPLPSLNPWAQMMEDTKVT